MSTKPRHIIRKLALDARCTDATTGRALHSRLSESLHARVLPGLEDFFDSLGDIWLERLELDLGALPADGWEAALQERLLEACKKALKAEAAQSGVPAKPGATVRPGHRAFEAYLFFLQTGRLPWWAEHYDLAALEKEILERRILHAAQPADTMLALLQARPDALKRLVFQAGTALLQTLWIRLPERQGKKAGREKPDWTRSRNDPAAQLVLLKSFAALVQANKPAKARRSLTDSTENKFEEPDTDPMGMDAVFVANAGLVLLNPFLSPFFQHLGLVEKNRFTGVAEQEQAVQWLHFLATGSLECPEPELILPKLLCNMPAGFPLNRWFAPAKEQVAEAEKLLNSAIRHWTVLKNSSAAGLREGFLQRSGKLETRADGAHKLTVERLAQDVLLEQLPWNINMLRLPWMEQFLFVEW